MNSIFKAGLEIQEFLKNKKWSFCFIGGIVSLRWGQARMTQDVDLSLFVQAGDEKKYVDAILTTFKGRIPDADNFAITNRVLLVSASNGVAADISLADLPFEKQMIERATPFEFCSGCKLITCSAEDLIVLKAFADRPQDWMDVESIIIRQEKLDTEYITKELSPLCEAKESPEILKKLQILIDNIRKKKT